MNIIIIVIRSSRSGGSGSGSGSGGVVVPWILWNLYFDLCMQCSTFRIHIARNIAIDTNDTVEWRRITSGY